MSTTTTRFDAATYLKTDEDVARYLDAALEEHDPEFFLVALGTAARAYGMSRIAAGAALGRESLYKALRAGANPQFVTVLRVLRSLGVRLHVAPKVSRRPAPGKASPKHRTLARAEC